MMMIITALVQDKLKFSSPSSSSSLSTAPTMRQTLERSLSYFFTSSRHASDSETLNLLLLVLFYSL